MRIHQTEAFYKEVHGIRLHDYTTCEQVPEANTCLVECDEGHFQEFKDVQSTFIYFIIEGSGTFFLDGVATPVVKHDVVVIKPNTALYYLGKLRMVLTVAPAWKAENEVHIRYIPQQKKTP